VKGNERREELVIGLFIGNKVGRSHQTFGVSGVVGNVALLVSHSHNVKNAGVHAPNASNIPRFVGRFLPRTHSARMRVHYFYTARAFANCDGTIMENVRRSSADRMSQELNTFVTESPKFQTMSHAYKFIF